MFTKPPDIEDVIKSLHSTKRFEAVKVRVLLWFLRVDDRRDDSGGAKFLLSQVSSKVLR